MPYSPRVLFVSEDKNAASELGAFLLKNGFDAVIACDGPGALKLARASHFDILVTDVEMSPVDGVRIASAFRNINPASHIFLRGSSNEVAQPLLVCANLAWDFRLLLKPVDPTQLVHALRRAWNHEPMLDQ